MVGAIVLAAACIVASCGSESASSPGRTDPDPAMPVRDPAQRYRVTAEVIGDTLCTGAIMDSLPPAGCQGYPIANFPWPGAEPSAPKAGRWYDSWSFVGTFDGTTFTLTEPPAPPQKLSTFDELRYAKVGNAPCPTPPNDWRITDATRLDANALAAWAQQLPGFVSIGATNRRADGSTMNVVDMVNRDVADPVRRADIMETPVTMLPGYGQVVPLITALSPLQVVYVAGDPAGLADAATAVYGGPVCVTQAARPPVDAQQLAEAMQSDEAKAAGVFGLGASGPPREPFLHADVLIADAVAQAWFDQRFGPGMVHLTGRFQPV